MYQKRLKTLFLLFSGAFLLLVARLAHLQLIQGEDLRAASLDQVEKLIELPSRRGNILDRNGRLLASSDPTTFDAAIQLDAYNRLDKKEASEALNQLAAYFQIDRSEIERSIFRINQAVEQMRSTEKNAYGRNLVAQREARTPQPVIRDLAFSQAAPLEVEASRFKFMRISPSYARKYPFGAAGAHVVGYMWQINAEQFKRYRDTYDDSPYKSYHITEAIGASGVESLANARLRGERGLRFVLTDNRNLAREVLWEKPPQAGSDVQLTLDIQWQAAAEEELARVGARAAMVVMNADTGELLVAASVPLFNPALIRKEYAKLAANPDKPLVNRAIVGLYPAGSVFKVVLALAALEDRFLADDTSKTYVCHHTFKLGNATFACTGTHGEVDLFDAIKRSCNIFFFHLGLDLGPGSIATWADKLGLGRETGLSLGYPVRGYLPSPSTDRPWSKGDTVNLSIGQGKLMVTPLQVARMMAVFGNGGYLVRPRIIATDTPSRERVSSAASLDRNIAIISRAMRAVVAETGGTAHKNANSTLVTLIGKTGTAQAGEDRRHGWFAGLQLDGSARYAFAVIVEDLTEGVHGGDSAALVARKFFEKVRGGAAQVVGQVEQ